MATFIKTQSLMNFDNGIGPYKAAIMAGLHTSVSSMLNYKSVFLVFINETQKISLTMNKSTNGHMRGNKSKRNLHAVEDYNRW